MIRATAQQHKHLPEAQGPEFDPLYKKKERDKGNKLLIGFRRKTVVVDKKLCPLVKDSNHHEATLQ